MSSERRRRAVFAVLMGLAILGAAALMASVLVEDMTWRVALQVTGLVTSSAASLAVVLTVRRWGAADDFWWLDSGSGADGADTADTADSADSAAPVERAAGRGPVYTPRPDADR